MLNYEIDGAMIKLYRQWQMLKDEKEKINLDNLIYKTLKNIIEKEELKPDNKYILDKDGKGFRGYHFGKLIFTIFDGEHKEEWDIIDLLIDYDMPLYTAMIIIKEYLK